MDGLSLLCNLHSDGPLALRRLRAAGVRELGDLEGFSEATLSACLRSSPAHARRFVAEARHLALRLAESALEPEPSADEEPERRVEREEQRTLGGPRAGTRPASMPAGEHALEPGVFAELDARICERLAGQGVCTLEALQEHAGLALARSAGIPLTKLLDLAALARLALSGTPRETKEERAREVLPHAAASEASRRAYAPGRRSIAFPSTASTSTSSTLRAPAGRAPTSGPGAAGPFG